MFSSDEEKETPEATITTTTEIANAAVVTDNPTPGTKKDHLDSTDGNGHKVNIMFIFCSIYIVSNECLLPYPHAGHLYD